MKAHFHTNCENAPSCDDVKKSNFSHFSVSAYVVGFEGILMSTHNTHLCGNKKKHNNSRVERKTIVTQTYF